jgi:hypothetical protein
MARRRMSVCMAGVCIALPVSVPPGSFLPQQPHVNPTHLAKKAAHLAAAPDCGGTTGFARHHGVAGGPGR